MNRHNGENKERIRNAEEFCLLEKKKKEGKSKAVRVMEKYKKGLYSVKCTTLLGFACSFRDVRVFCVSFFSSFLGFCTLPFFSSWCKYYAMAWHGLVIPSWFFFFFFDVQTKYSLTQLKSDFFPPSFFFCFLVYIPLYFFLRKEKKKKKI